MSLASRTEAPDLAYDMLRGLHIIPTFSDNPSDDTRSKRAITYFVNEQIFRGDKRKHFHNIQQATNIRYEDMVFFDDEARNMTVAKLGVTFCLVRDGMTKDEVDRGVWEWRRNQGIRVSGNRPEEAG